MSVNFNKSVAVLVLRGNDAAGIKRRFLKWRGGRYVLIVGYDDMTGKDIQLPVQEKREYLGAVLSYGALEQQTLTLRSSRARANFQRLKPVLRTSSAFSRAHRLRIFKACVVPALLYGIVGVGISASVLREIKSQLAVMLRKVLRVYEHGISNQEVLARARATLTPGDSHARRAELSLCINAWFTACC